MALHPSGYHDDVELVKIETEDMSLVVKGKPYHERYEGLKQYRAMDRHDVMQFSVHGEKVSQVLIYNIETQLLKESSQLRPIFSRMVCIKSLSCRRQIENYLLP